LQQRRGWEDPLDQACFISGIDRATLDAMLAETRAAFPVFRSYLEAKARLIGIEKLAWFDLFAPVGEAGLSWEWLDAVALLEDRFGRFSPSLGQLMTQAVSERWIDSGPRSGKQGGAYCTHLRDGESRVLMNFTPSFDSVSTLAHEMGHAYHNRCEQGLTPLQRQTPMTLAETASTFCETLVYDALLEQSSGSARLFMLDQLLQGSTQVCVDIVSRFDFERSVFARRRDRELTISEFCGLMTDAQLATYGEGLDSQRLHPWMWAVKGHYYMDGTPFYNFPYLFGLLFGMGLYARYQQVPHGFVPRYERLLGSTGQADAAALAAGFGIDLRDGAFWRDSLDTIGGYVDQFCSAVDEEVARESAR
jgi:oligoendopeptidase F